MVPRVARNETENPLQQVNHDLCRRPRQEKDDKESGKSERAVQLELQENVGRLYMTRKNNPRCPFLNKTNTWKVLTIPFKQRRREEKKATSPLDREGPPGVCTSALQESCASLLRLQEVSDEHVTPT